MKAYRIVFAILSLAAASPAWADDLSAAATAGAVAELQKLGAMFPQAPTQQPANFPFLPQYQSDPDENGAMGTYQPNGATVVAASPFFRSLGTNGRTCFTCHQPQNGWALSAGSAQKRFDADPTDPLFRLVDGAVCPSADLSNPSAAYALLLKRGLIRIGLPMQDAMQFQITGVQDDPYNCSTNPVTGLTGAKSGFLSFYRRPLPSTNLNVLTSIMWDGREPDLFHQAVDATLGHAEGKNAPPAPLQKQIVSLEGCTTAMTSAACSGIPAGEGMVTAQDTDNSAGDLTANGATGGPLTLADAIDDFYLHINDPFAGGGQSFNPVIFTRYSAWASLTGTDPQSLARRAIARGQQVFNTVTFKITGVAGLNDVQGHASITGTCGTCHNTPDVGNHSSNVAMNIGVTSPDRNNPHILNTADLPVFSVLCTSGPLAGASFEVTDLGVAMISGKCDDIGKTKVPVLRGLPGRSPYFHNGAATEIENLIEFYDHRFQIGLTPQQKMDLAAFLESL